MGDQPPSSNFDRHKWKGKCNQVIDILGFFTKLNSLSHATERESTNTGRVAPLCNESQFLIIKSIVENLIWQLLCCEDKTKHKMTILKCKRICYYLLLLLSHFSHVRLCATTSLGFSRQEHWSGLPFPSPICIKVKSESEVAQSCLTPWDPMDCSLPGSSVHGIFQARVLEWGAIVFSDVTTLLLLRKSLY